MTTITSKRKKYVRDVPANWWKRLDFYKAYMLREATSIPTVWFCIVLLYGVICISKGIFGVIGFITFLQNPFVVILNIIALAGAAYNTYTWFNLTPKALNLIVNNQRVKQPVINKIMWAITIVASVVTLVLVYL